MKDGFGAPRFACVVVKTLGGPVAVVVEGYVFVADTGDEETNAELAAAAAETHARDREEK